MHFLPPALATGKKISARPSKIVGGHEPDLTNAFLVAIAEGIKSKVENGGGYRHVRLELGNRVLSDVSFTYLFLLTCIIHTYLHIPTSLLTYIHTHLLTYTG